MNCTNGCALPAVRYVEHYRELGASRIYPEGKAGTGLVCARCGTHHDAGYDAYERYLATPQSERAFPAAAAAPADPASQQSGAEAPRANVTSEASAHDEGGGGDARPARGDAARGSWRRLSAQFVGWLIDAIVGLVRRKTAR
jgi:hypothetical protein